MRTSGGAGVSSRRLRDATPAEAAPAPPQWSQLESHVTVGADGIATSRGAGRQRSDGLSITRSIPVETGIAPDAAVDDQAIKFTPPRVELGRMETCSPQRYYVGVENRGRVSVRLDGADFTHSGFSLATDVRGIRLDPGDRFNLQFVFLPSDVEPNGVDAHLRVLTTSGLFALPISSPEVALNRYGVGAIRASVPAGVRFGQSLQFVNPVDYTIRITEIYALDSFVHIELLDGSGKWIGPRWPREDDGKEVRQEAPGEYDKEFDYARRADRGAWDMPAGTTSPLIKVSLLSSTPGVYFTHIHIAAGSHRLLLVPVHITVLKPGIHIEPKELDLGVLTDLHEDEPREVFFTLFNAGVNPIEVLELKVLESNLLVSAHLWGGSTVIPPRTQVNNALAVQLRVDKAERSGYCFASLLLKTNASSSELGQRKLKLYGQVIRGSMAFQANETRVGVVLPLQHLFYDGEGTNDTSEQNGGGQTVDDDETSTTKLVSRMGENVSMGIMAGTSAIQELRLWNRFDRPMELQRVWIDYSPSDQENQEVAVYRFKQSVVSAGSAWPKISLQITPALRGKEQSLAPRSYPLIIETNITRHRIQVYVYHGFLSVDSSRGLQNYSVSGYYSSNATATKSLHSCVEVPKDGVVPTTSPRIDGGERMTDTQAVQLCRSLLFDLEKVASHNSRTEVIEITNENPVPITLEVVSIPASDTVDLLIRDVHGAGARRALERPSSNHTDGVVVGDIFVVQPGHQIVLYVKVQAKDTLGKLTVPVMSLATPVEILHFHARLLSVRGTVEPITPAIVLPSMFPGRTQIIHLKYRNTFEHPVIPLMATTSSPNLKLLSIRSAMAPKQVENVLDLLFSPAADSKCSGALFFADCLLPQSTMVDQTCEQLSGYGELVDENDLVALSRRNAFWSRALGDDHLSTVETRVHLQTDIMDDVADVTVKALLERPVVTTPLKTLRNDSTMIFERKEFALTELLHLNYIFVHVRNPSNVSIHMELTRAEADEPLFYSCDEGFDHLNDNKEGDSTTEISALCLDEWMGAASNAVALQREVQVDLNVPPFYFRRKVIQVGAGEETQLGPIYYLPSKVQEVTTAVFVRNSLSHIEPVPLLARSGKGTLNLLVDAADSSNSDKIRFLPHRLAEVNSPVEIDELLDFEGTLRFDLTQHDALTDYSRDTEILLGNTGPFGLTIHSVKVEREDGLSWLPWMWASKTASATSEFEVSSEYPQATLSNEGNSVVLQPGKTAHLQVSFCASCFATNVASWLIIDTSDGVKRIRLEGTISTEASFSCLRSRMSPSFRYALRTVWMLAVIIAVVSTLYTLLMLTRDSWTSETISVASFSVSTEGISVAVSEELTAASRMEDERDVRHQTLESTNRLLEGMERAAFAPTARVVTPAVTALLERRHKGVYSNLPKDLPSQLLEATYETKEARDNATSPPVVANMGDEAALVVKGEQISPSDVASTVTEASLQEEVVNEGDEDIGTLLVSTEPVSKPTIILSRLLDGNDGRKHNDLSSDEDSATSEHSSVASSHSTIVPPESEESSRGADIPKMTFGSANDAQLKPVMRADRAAPIGTSSPQKEEGPFEAFKSLSERWRTQNWQDNFNDPSPLPKLPSLEDWNDSLSFNRLGQSLVAGNQRESLSSGSRSESSSFLGTGSGLYLDSFSAFAGSAAPALKAATTKAPPGFTPADAKPLETRAAFERLRSGSGATAMTSNSNDAFGGSLAFAGHSPLFGPALPPTNSKFVALGSAGRIGSRPSKVLRVADSPLETSADIGNKQTGPH
ncbi:hypothetical protein PF010_g3795 [Phytophthora fragariae]|uniref:Transmembrane protein n=3 Tax=Phytophthora fragariae TaxID=53985 RepID=A0A6G0LT44_9STRA|nr:hypothetical protein PF010_g3795 [Phytophthora fragariae]